MLRDRQRPQGRFCVVLGEGISVPISDFVLFGFIVNLPPSFIPTRLSSTFRVVVPQKQIACRTRRKYVTRADPSSVSLSMVVEKMFPQKSLQRRKYTVLYLHFRFFSFFRTFSAVRLFISVELMFLKHVSLRMITT